MTALRILYIGPDSGTSKHRALALARLGHRVKVVEPRRFLPRSRLLDYWNHHTGSYFFGQWLANRALKFIDSLGEFDLVWVDGGELVTPFFARELTERFGRVVNYNVDDPYGSRDAGKWRNYLASVPVYGLVIVVRECNIGEAYEAGAQRVIRVHRSADEVAHSPRKLSASDRSKWSSDVAFVGTWMPERGPLLARLVELGVPLTIYGDRWNRAREWPALRASWRSSGLYNDEDYAKAIQCAKVCIGLLSKGNRDLCTTRSFEIPHLGGVLCAERTVEHVELYREDEEAVFWSTPEECAGKCLRLLHDGDLRNRIGVAARTRCLRNGTTNETVLSTLIEAATTTSRASAEDHRLVTELDGRDTTA